MSCSVELLNWLNECYAEEKRERESDCWLSFKKDIKGKSKKITFGKTHLAREGYRRYECPDIQYGYKILCQKPFNLKKGKQVPNGGKWSESKICCYDPNPNKNCIMFEVFIEETYSYHCMNLSIFKEFISSNEITIKKII